MTILSGDIVIAASQTMDDVPEGGGAPTSTLIVDNSSNGIFNDISELDRAGGRVNLRKIFPSIRTVNVDGYFGANFIVADPPKDPLVTVTLFSTNDTFDHRDDAKSRIEAYLAQGTIYSGYLFGDHIAGQGAVTLLQRDGLPLPVNGDTFVLRKNEGLATQVEQYVRVTKVTTVERTFSDASGDFQRLEVTLTISDVLRSDFPGFPAIRYDANINYGTSTKVYNTIVADAARYFGVRPMTAIAHLGDFTIKADTIFTQIVPSTRVETPIADARMNQQAIALVAAAGGALTQTFTLLFTTAQQLFVGGGILPGSLSVARGGITVTDKGGTLQGPAGQVGIVDYDNGILTLTTNIFGSTSGTHTVTYMPASTPIIVSESVGVPVTQQGQRLTWIVPIAPTPARGSLQISFRAQARWYVMNEDGSGAIRGSDSSTGAGTLNYDTGTVSLTLGALPDVDSQIIFEWAPAVTSQALGALGTAVSSLQSTLIVPNAIKPGTVTITWNDGTARTSTDSGGGVLAGDANGNVDYATGRVIFSPKLLPAKGTAISLAITNAAQALHSVATMTDAGANWSFNIGSPVRAGGVRLAAVASHPTRQYPGEDATVFEYLPIFDDINGNLVLNSPVGSGASNVGTINYATGACTLVKSLPTGYSTLQPTFATSTVDSTEGVTKIAQTGTESRVTPVTFLNTVDSSVVLPPYAWWTGTANVVEAVYCSTDGSAQTYPFTFDTAFMTSGDVGVTGFMLGTHQIKYDTASGTYQIDPLPTTGQGTAIGTRSLQNAKPGVLLTSWPTGASSTATAVSGAKSAKINGILAESVTFRSAISPLFNGGFSFNFTVPNQSNPDLPGVPYTVTADSNGIINSSNVVGRINYDTGVATVRFGDHVAPPGATAQDISYLNIPGITSINPLGIAADSLRYSAVGYSYLPLDANILGLDPVRLPADGRVPIFRPGSFAVVGNTKTIAAATYANGNSVDCGRVRLSRIRVIGFDNVVINTGYTVDLEAGIVSIVNVAGWAQPVTIEHRVEDMSVVSDAQISGQLTFTAALTHDYPFPGSYVSSALVAGDMHARVSLTFDQQTWTNVWSDDPIGSPATGTFDTISHPITITNIGGLTERWAVVFTSTTAFNVIGEHVGVIAVGTTNVDSSPLNPATSQPYFTIPALGWGLGWTPGNALRFNTVGAEYPVWVIRTIQQGPATVDDDSFQLLVRGDVNKP